MRYETSTKVMLGLMGPLRMVHALLHDQMGPDKWLPRSARGEPVSRVCPSGPSGARQPDVPFGAVGAQVRTSWPSPTTAK